MLGPHDPSSLSWIGGSVKEAAMMSDRGSNRDCNKKLVAALERKRRQNPHRGNVA